MKKKMPKAVKETLEAMAKDHICPPPITKVEVQEKIIYREILPAWLSIIFILGAFVLGHFLCPKVETANSYPVYIHDQDPWKRKCQNAWRVLNYDRTDGERAFQILDK